MIINDTLLERIKERVSLQEVVSTNVVLHRGGQNKMVGLCPFHAESTPSFYTFTAGKWIEKYHCFGCGAHGDVINYIMEVNGIDFKEAVTLMVQYYNIDTSDCGANSDTDFKTAPKVSKPIYTVVATTTVRKTFCQYEANHFITFLNTYFNDYQLVNDLIQRYYIGTARNGKTIFWLVDGNGSVRTGQIILYDKNTGKRSRTEPIQWTHSSIPNFVMEQCFFGLHLLATEPKTKPIAIVESPKTAVLMSALMSDFIWLASCGKNGLSDSKMEALAGRTIVLYPDLGRFDVKRDGQTVSITAFQLWSEQAQRFNQQGFKVSVSDTLEQYVKSLPESLAIDYVSKGYDLADYAIAFKWYDEIRRTKKQDAYSKDDLEWIHLVYGSLDAYERHLQQEELRLAEPPNVEVVAVKKEHQSIQYLDKEAELKIKELAAKREAVKNRTDDTLLRMF
jgi:hypothetical protein